MAVGRCFVPIQKSFYSAWNERPRWNNRFLFENIGKSFILCCCCVFTFVHSVDQRSLLLHLVCAHIRRLGNSGSDARRPLRNIGYSSRYWGGEKTRDGKRNKWPLDFFSANITENWIQHDGMNDGVRCASESTVLSHALCMHSCQNLNWCGHAKLWYRYSGGNNLSIDSTQ